MKTLKLALAAACAFASTAASAGVVENKSANGASDVSTCYWRYSVITPDAEYHYYECYSNGDGTY